MPNVKLHPQALVFTLDKVSIALSEEELKNPEVIKIFKNESQFELHYRAVRAPLTPDEAKNLNHQFKIQIV